MEKHTLTNREHALLDKFIDKYIDGYKEGRVDKTSAREALAYVITLMQNEGSYSVVKHIGADLGEDKIEF